MLLDVGVVGGGLMGLATSHFLLRSERCRVTLYDASFRRPALGYSSCASAVAGGLLHPLTPRLKPAWEATDALNKADALIRAAEHAAQCRLVTTSTVLRPAVDAQDALDLEAAAGRAGPAWLEWLGPAPFAGASGRADFGEGGLRYVGGRCVDARGYLAALKVLNEASDVFSVVEASVDPRGLGHTETILCGGADAYRKFPDLFPAGLTLTRGESLVYAGGINGPALLRGAYLCPGSGGSILGATHEHFSDADAPVDAPPRSIEALLTHELREAAALLAAPGAVPAGATAGVRLNGPRTHLGRLPFAFRREPGLWVAGGLGARGFLRHAQLGEVVANAVLGETDVPEAFRPRGRAAE